MYNIGNGGGDNKSFMLSVVQYDKPATKVEAKP